MAPGLTSPGGRLPLPADDPAAVPERGAEGERLDPDEHWTRELQKGEPVIVRAEGKSEACAVGFLLMGTQEVREKGKGPVIEDAHYLGDGLWNMSID